MGIAKPFKRHPPDDKFGRAGYEAEKQMAFYLKRGFADASDIFVYNDLRFVRNAEVSQIDHLVLHRYGFVLVESKSVTGTMDVNKQLEFVRTYGRNRTGMKSPITQVNMQAELLQKLLNEHKESLRRKVMLGLIQAEFGDARFTKFVAVSDNGEIRRKQCDPPELVKADRVVNEIRDLITRRDKTQGLGGMVRRAVADKATARKMDNDEVMPFSNDELTRIRKFIRKHHNSAQPSKIKPQPAKHIKQRTPPPPLPSKAAPRKAKRIRKKTEHSCKHCNSTDVRILYGPYGYYFECLDCEGNTRITATCDECNAAARISKRKLTFTKICKQCDHSSHYFTNPT